MPTLQDLVRDLVRARSVNHWWPDYLKACETDLCKECGRLKVRPEAECYSCSKKKTVFMITKGSVIDVVQFMHMNHNGLASVSKGFMEEYS